MVTGDQVPLAGPAHLGLEGVPEEIGDVAGRDTQLDRLPVDHRQRTSALGRPEQHVVDAEVRSGRGPVGRPARLSAMEASSPGHEAGLERDGVQRRSVTLDEGVPDEREHRPETASGLRVRSHPSSARVGSPQRGPWSLAASSTARAASAGSHPAIWSPWVAGARSSSTTTASAVPGVTAAK